MFVSHSHNACSDTAENIHSKLVVIVVRSTTEQRRAWVAMTADLLARGRCACAQARRNAAGPITAAGSTRTIYSERETQPHCEKMSSGCIAIECTHALTPSASQEREGAAADTIRTVFVPYTFVAHSLSLDNTTFSSCQHNHHPRLYPYPLIVSVQQANLVPLRSPKIPTSTSALAAKPQRTPQATVAAMQRCMRTRRITVLLSRLLTTSHWGGRSCANSTRSALDKGRAICQRATSRTPSSRATSSHLAHRRWSAWPMTSTRMTKLILTTRVAWRA